MQNFIGFVRYATYEGDVKALQNSKEKYEKQIYDSMTFDSELK